MRYLVTRHSGAKEWVENKGIAIDQLLEHVDPFQLKAGDTVVGTLPVNLIEKLTHLGVRYYHIKLNLDESHRGKELTAEEMNRLGAEIEEFRVKRGNNNLISKLKTIKSWPGRFWKWLKRCEQHAIMVWVYTTLSLLSFAWFGDAISGTEVFKDFFSSKVIYEEQNYESFFGVVFFCFYLFFSWRLFEVGRKIFPPIRDVKMRKTSKPTKVLIFNLSTLRNNKLEKEGDQFVINFNSGKQVVIGGKDLKSDISVLSEQEKGKEGILWNWTQMLRGINSHQHKVEKIILVMTETTRNGEGADKYGEIAKQLLSSYFAGSNTEIILHSEFVEVSDVSRSYHVYNTMISSLIEEGYDETDITVDITGGTSTLSTACAMATLHNRAQFQYVSTDGTGSLTQYDLQLNLPQKK